MAQQNMASAGLPEKNWFKLDEIAERWGCSVDLLTHYAETGMLRVCANFHRVTGTEVILRSNAKGEEVTVERVESSAPVGGIYGIRAEDIAALNRYGRVRPSFLYKPDQKYATSVALCKLLAEDGGRYTFIEPADNESIWYGFDGDGEPSWSGGLPSVDYVTADKLLVTRVERNRFEEQHRIGAHAGQMPSDVAPGEVVETESMRLILQASREFWSTPDPEEPTTHPPKKDVVEWLKEKGMTGRLADAMATIIRPDWAHAGRRKK